MCVLLNSYYKKEHTKSFKLEKGLDKKIYPSYETKVCMLAAKK